MKKYDIIIIGGGASGMIAAIKSKEKHPDKSVAILEKQKKLGRKLLATGNGRCNLSNTGACEYNYNGSFSKYVDVVFDLCPPEKVVSEFERIGLITRTEQDGRVYPVSNQASSVLDVLNYRLQKLDVEIILDFAVENIEIGSGFSIKSKNKEFCCEKIIVCSGSCASPKLGSDSSGVSILNKLGHKTVAFSPALCPIKVKSKSLKSMKGVRARGKASLYNGKKLIKEEIGEIQFTEDRLSGICLFNLSSKLRNLDNPVIKLDLLPQFSKGEVFNILQKNKDLFAEQNCSQLLTGVFNCKLGAALVKKAVDPNKNCKELSDSELKTLADTIKSGSFTAEKSIDFSSAQVAAGGVKGDEINPYTMESNVVPNLFLCGEIIDIDGECGGFNLQFAFASGIIAGENV